MVRAQSLLFARRCVCDRPVRATKGSRRRASQSRVPRSLAARCAVHPVTLWQQGEFDDAARELRAAIRAKPDYAEAYYTLGPVLKQQGKLPEAAAALREAIRLQPEFAGAQTTLAAVLRQSGDTAGAAAESRAGSELARHKDQ
jgi:cytochrome c-type biogenesis protein CcmH/NrfG